MPTSHTWKWPRKQNVSKRVGPLSLEDRLGASGKVALRVGPPDSGVYLGWFNGGEKGLSPLLWLPPRGLRKGDSAAPGLKVRDEPERGDEEK